MHSGGDTISCFCVSECYITDTRQLALVSDLSLIAVVDTLYILRDVFIIALRTWRNKHACIAAYRLTIRPILYIV